MLIHKLESRAEIIAADGTILREILRPEGADVAVRYSLAHARLAANQVSKQHRLGSSEVYYILAGAGTMQIDGERQEVAPGDCIYIFPHLRSSISRTRAEAIWSFFVLSIQPGAKRTKRFFERMFHQGTHLFPPE